MSTLVVGVDIAQDTLVAASWHHGSGQLLGMFPNSDAGFTALVAALPTVSSIHLVMERTGGFELPLAMFAIRRGWRVSLPNPRQVRDFAKGRGRRAKTDPQDALVLARFGAEANPPAWQPLPSEVAELELSCLLSPSVLIAPYAQPLTLPVYTCDGGHPELGRP